MTGIQLTFPDTLRRSWIIRLAPRILSVGVVIASLAAFGWVASGAVDAKDTLAQVRWAPFTAAVLLQLVALTFLMLCWEKLLSLLRGGRSVTKSGIPGTTLFAAYSRSWLARYIPGRVWALGGRMLLASRVGVPARAVARSMAFEVLFSYSIVTILGGALLVAARVHLVIGGLLLVFGVALFVLSLPKVLRWLTPSNRVRPSSSLLGRFRRRTQRFIVGSSAFSTRNNLWAVSVYAVYSGLQLAFIILIAQSFVDLTWNQALIVAGAWGLSITLGWVAFLAPVGLGVRDGLAFVLFAQVLDLPTASLVVATARVVMVAADLVFVSLIEVLVLGLNVKQPRSQIADGLAGS